MSDSLTMPNSLTMTDTAKRMQGSWPLSAAQRGIWLGQQLNPQSALYNTAECLEILGDLNSELFERSLRQAVAEAETLNLRFDRVKEEPVQYVVPSSKWTLQHLDLSTDPDSERAAWAWMRQNLSERTHLTKGELFAQALIRIAPNRYFWYQRIHHIAIDGYGSSLLIQRVAEIYTALTHGRLVSSCPFGSLQPVLEEDICYQTSQQKDCDRAYWLNELANAPEPVSLSAKTAAASHGCLRKSSTLPPEIFADLQTVAQQMGASWPDILLAVTAVYLHQSTGATHFILGMPMMGRLGSAALRVPAMVMNIVPLRVLVSPKICFSELVEQIKQRRRAIRPHSRYRYEQLRRDLNRVGGGRRLFGALVNIMPFDSAISFGNAAAIAHNVSAGPVEDLAINVRTAATGQTLKLELDGNPDCYSPEDLAQHQQNWLASLKSALQNPDQVVSSTAPLMERFGIQGLNQSLGNIISGEPLESPCKPVLDRFIEQVLLRPHADAVVAGDLSLSYSELLALAQNLGSRLASAGVKPGQIIAIHLPRSCEAIVAILGTLFSGAAYLALDPAAPVARNTSLLKDAQPVLLITQTEHRPQSIPNLPHQVLLDRLSSFPATEPLPSPTSDALAYMVYTSGSTGTPKGVIIDHRALASFVDGALQRYGIQSNDRILQFASLHFDASVEEIFLALCSGAALVLREESMIQSLPHFLNVCQQQKITILDLPTAFWHELAFCVGNHQARLPPSLRMVLIGGEAAQLERVKQWHLAVGNAVTLLNTYGPSETTVVATVATLEPGSVDSGDVPIGLPLPGVEVAVLDAAGQPTAVGQLGELYILGPTLAKGYRGQSQLTADRFVHLNQFSGNPRAYRTGDQVFVRPDGQLVFTGRLDTEFKISGHRINLAEIESVLSAIPGIREVVVIGYSLPGGVKRLCAYLVAETPAPSVQALRQHLAERLPAAVIPTGFNFTHALPKTASGKVDRAALHSQAPDWVTHHHLDSPSSLEALILSIWEAILGQQTLTVQDDFFELGGQSLQTIQVANRLSAKLAREISISTIFRYPTAAALAKALKSDTQGDSEIPGDIDRRLPAAGVNTSSASFSSTLFSPLFPITEGKQPLFCIHPAAGISWCYLGLAKQLGFQQPLYGLQSPYLNTRMPSLDDLPQDRWAQMIEQYLVMIRQVQPEGSYRLLGWSLGGMIAHAIATRLQQQDAAVDLLVLLDAYPSHHMKNRDRPSEQDAINLLFQAVGQTPEISNQKAQKNTLAQLRRSGLGSQIDPLRLNTLLEITQYNVQMARQAPVPDTYHGNLLFFTANHERTEAALTHSAWQPFVAGLIENHNLNTTHGQILTGKYLKTIAQAIADHTNS